MSSLTIILEDEAKVEQKNREWSEWCLKMARWDLKSARNQKDSLDVSNIVEDIRHWVKSEGLALADVGTTEEELAQLLQTGYESEARSCLEIARDMHGCSFLELYARGVRNYGKIFFEEMNFYWFKSLLKTIFCLYPRRSRQYYIVRTRECLAKANLSLTDIGTDESELVRLGSSRV